MIGRLIVLVAMLSALVLGGCSDASLSSSQARVASMQTSPPTSAPAPSFRGSVFDDSGTLVGPVAIPKVQKPDDVWKKELDREAFSILRRADTERPFTGALLENKSKGAYVCRGCGLPLFSSDTKFESGTGWPSFYRAIAPGNVAEKVDLAYGMKRTEILCARCDGHLGHVFDDGPEPTGLRYCLNSASLAFHPTTELKTLADPAAMNTSNSNSNASTPSSLRTAVFAGGCFWCVEAVFEELKGVREVVSGYAGGMRETANYKAVCSGQTKHAEAVQIVYDPAQISFEDLLRVHFATHDPTQLNRQGNDVGPQYRSAIFFANDDERRLAKAFITDLNDQKVFKQPVVTTIEPLVEFFPAEAHHQNYVCNNPTQGYVRAIALPKVEKVRKSFGSKLKETSPLEKR